MLSFSLLWRNWKYKNMFDKNDWKMGLAQNNNDPWARESGSFKKTMRYLRALYFSPVINKQ